MSSASAELFIILFCYSTIRLDTSLVLSCLDWERSVLYFCIALSLKGLTHPRKTVSVQTNLKAKMQTVFDNGCPSRAPSELNNFHTQSNTLLTIQIASWLAPCALTPWPLGGW